MKLIVHVALPALALLAAAAPFSSASAAYLYWAKVAGPGRGCTEYVRQVLQPKFQGVTVRGEEVIAYPGVTGGYLSATCAGSTVMLMVFGDDGAQVQAALRRATAAFDQPIEPAPEEAAPPTYYEPREFVVYFNANDPARLTEDARAVVEAAADYAKAGNAQRILVVGHADTFASAATSIRMSEESAKAVADALASMGVNSDILAVDWKGEGEPAVATGDGVREPLNRRATITITF